VATCTGSEATFDDFIDMKATFGPNVVKAVQHMTADHILERDRYMQDGLEHHEILEMLQDLLSLAG
ncbi:MAG: hypothetical protein WBF37_04905, partial [Dehalococcoidia bacterium]